MSHWHVVIALVNADAAQGTSDRAMSPKHGMRDVLDGYWKKQNMPALTDYVQLFRFLEAATTRRESRILIGCLEGGRAALYERVIALTLGYKHDEYETRIRETKFTEGVEAWDALAALAALVVAPVRARTPLQVPRRQRSGVSFERRESAAKKIKEERKKMTELTLEIGWADKDCGLSALLGPKLRAYLDECRKRHTVLIQVLPFTLASRRIVLRGVRAPTYTQMSWSELQCATIEPVAAAAPTGEAIRCPALKYQCPKFPRPKIFLRLARLGGLFGFGAYVEWLRYASARHGLHGLHGLATAEWYHTRLVGLMRRVFKRGHIQVHGTDVAFFHLKSAR